MDLALGRTCADCAPAYQVGNKLPGHHIEKLGGGRYAQFIDLQQQATRQLEAVIHPIAAVEVGVGDQPLPADHRARSGDVSCNFGRHRMPLSQFRGRYQAFNARGTQFVCFIHWGLKNLFLPRRKCREVMRITINQSLLIARAGHDPV